MKRFSSENITDLIFAWGDGEKTALDEVIPLIYEELRRLAARHMRRENPAHTFQTTTLPEQEIAEVEQVSMRIVERDWCKARAWLHDEMSP